MGSNRVKQNKKLWDLSGRTQQERIKEAQDNGNTAKLLFDKGKMGDIITAIDNDDFNAFGDACKAAGIIDLDLITRMWDATMGSLNAQSAKPCW
jgi:hypothetical protein